MPGVLEANRHCRSPAELIAQHQRPGLAVPVEKVVPAGPWFARASGVAMRIAATLLALISVVAIGF